MNILFVAHNIYPCKIGGAEIFNYYLIKKLAKLHNIYILTTCNKEIDLDAVIIRLNRRMFGLARISLPLLDLANIIKLRNEIDVVHLSYMGAERLPWIPYLITNKLFNVPYVITIHGGGMYKWKSKFPQKYLFDNAFAVVGVSQRIKSEYEQRTDSEIKFIPPLIPFSMCKEEKSRLRNQYGFRTDETIFLSLGSINEIKGSGTLLNAFMSLDRDFIEEHRLRLILVGDGDMRKELENKTKQGDYNRYIKFIGCVPREEVASFYRMSDIYLITSLFEGTPISVLEALFNKMPIIGSNVNGIKDIIEHKKNGLLFEASNSEDLKKKIVFLINNKDIAIEIACNAERTYNAKYNDGEFLKKYMAIYEELERTVKK